MPGVPCGKCPLWDWAVRAWLPEDPDRKCIVDNKWHRPTDRPFCRYRLLDLRDAINKAIATWEAVGVIGEGCIAPNIAKCDLGPHAGCGACRLRSKTVLAKAGENGA